MRRDYSSPCELIIPLERAIVYTLVLLPTKSNQSINGTGPAEKAASCVPAAVSAVPPTMPKKLPKKQIGMVILRKKTIKDGVITVSTDSTSVALIINILTSGRGDASHILLFVCASILNDFLRPMRMTIKVV